MKWIGSALAVALIGAFCVMAVGCNTIKGVGRDLERGGEKLQNAAER